MQKCFPVLDHVTSLGPSAALLDPQGGNLKKEEAQSSPGVPMSVYLLELYPLENDKRSKYRVLMKKIHAGLRAHAEEMPELLSYRTFEAGSEGPMARFAEIFEFTDQDGRERFFRRFSEAKWLQGLAKDFYEVVDRSKMQNVTMSEFLKDDWLIRAK